MSKRAVGLFSKAISTGTKMGLCASVSITAILMSSMGAEAQQTDESVERKVLESITVTGTKREQTLQDTPVAISVVTQDVMTKAEIQDIADLQSLVPSLSVSFMSSAMDSSVRAFDVRTGKVKWSAELPGNGMSTPMSYVSETSGKQFVIVTVPNPGWRYPRDPVSGTYTDSQTPVEAEGGYVIAYALEE